MRIVSLLPGPFYEFEARSPNQRNFDVHMAKVQSPKPINRPPTKTLNWQFSGINSHSKNKWFKVDWHP